MSTNIEVTQKQNHAKKVAEYRKRNPEKTRESLYKYWKKPYVCDCGSITTMKNKMGHRKSKKHARNIEILESLKPKSISE